MEPTTQSQASIFIAQYVQVLSTRSEALLQLGPWTLGQYPLNLLQTISKSPKSVLKGLLARRSESPSSQRQSKLVGNQRCREIPLVIIVKGISLMRNSPRKHVSFACLGESLTVKCCRCCEELHQDSGFGTKSLLSVSCLPSKAPVVMPGEVK